MSAQVARRPLLRMSIGEQVQDRRGRVGTLTQVNTDVVFVRFDGASKASYMHRGDVTPVAYLRAMAEVEEDDRNAAAYRAARS